MSRGTSQTVVWDPADYAANSSVQHAWACEQIARLKLKGNERVLDVGCGDGRVTSELAKQLPRGAVVGVDNSPQMIGYARSAFPACKHPNLEFHVMDARELRFERSFNVVFSNAALHWVNDHQAFLRSAADCLRSGGRLTVSCGGKGNAQDVFAVVRGRMRVNRWRPYFRKMEAPYYFHRAEDYRRWLSRWGFAPLSVRLVPKEIGFSSETLGAWLRTTWLPYTQRVPCLAREGFVTEVVNRFVTKQLPNSTGQLLVKMVRLEMDALKL